MRILQVAHGWPPEQAGGVEQYTRQLSRALAARGHEVWVFARAAEARRPEYDVREELQEGVRVARVNHTWRACHSFEESYRHEAIARRFGEALDRLGPDVVHLQHLVHLSTRLPDEARRRGIPVVMTFHDYWLLCNQGQLLRRNGQICEEAVSGTCTDCAGLWLGMGSPARRALNALERWWPDIRVRTSRLRSLAHRYYRLKQRLPAQRRLACGRIQARRREMLRVLETLRKAPALIARRLTEINVTDPQQIRLVLDGQTEVRCGSEAELGAHLERLRAALNVISKEHLSVQYIDVRFPEPVVGPRT